MSQSSQVFEWYRRLCDGRRSLGDEKGHQHGDRATWLSIIGQSCILTYNDKVAMYVRIFLVVKGHMFVSGTGQNSDLDI